MGYLKEIREYARELAYSLNDGATVISVAPWNKWCNGDWKSCNNIVRGSMLMFKKFKTGKNNIKIEVWGFYSHTSSDGINDIEKADYLSLRRLIVFYFKNKKKKD
jgi:hypothetical protein